LLVSDNATILVAEAGAWQTPDVFSENVLSIVLSDNILSEIERLLSNMEALPFLSKMEALPLLGTLSCLLLFAEALLLVEIVLEGSPEVAVLLEVVFLSHLGLVGGISSA